MFSYAGKTALITGASSGIGAEFARTLAARQVNLILVARSTERLNALAETLCQQHGIRAEVITADLGQPEITRRIMEEVKEKNLRIDLLINNAGFGLYGHFENHRPEQDQQQIMVDVATVVDLTHAVLPTMLEQPEESAIINVASMAAFQPTPYMSVYGASKAFVLSFSLALAEEYRQRGLRVVTLCPGATDTAFFETSGEMAGAEQKRTSAQVVATGLKTLERGHTLGVDGRRNHLMAAISDSLPSKFAARLMARLTHPSTSPEPDRTKASSR